MQLSTLVLKEDNSHYTTNFCSGVRILVKFLLVDFTIFHYHMTARACAGHKTLLIFLPLLTDWKLCGVLCPTAIERAAGPIPCICQ